MRVATGLDDDDGSAVPRTRSDERRKLVKIVDSFPRVQLDLVKPVHARVDEFHGLIRDGLRGWFHVRAVETVHRVDD